MVAGSAGWPRLGACWWTMLWWSRAELSVIQRSAGAPLILIIYCRHSSPARQLARHTATLTRRPFKDLAIANFHSSLGERLSGEKKPFAYLTHKILVLVASSF